MDEKELIEVEEVAEVAEEVIKSGNGKGIATGIGIGFAILIAGKLAYNYGVKPTIAKIKTKIEQKKNESADCDDEGSSESKED